MAYSAHEVPGSRRGDNQRITRQYYVYDATDEDDVLAFIGTLPDPLAGLPFADFDYEETEEIEGAYKVTVNWGTPKNSQPSQSIASIEYKFNYQAPGGHIYQSLGNLALYPDPALGSNEGGAAEPGLFGGAINVVSDDGKYRVEGINLPSPHETFTLSYRDTSGVIDGTYQLLVESMCGMVNSSDFRGRPAGSLLLARVTGGRDTSGVWYIEFGFAYSPNVTGLNIGAIEGIAKDGWDLCWTFYRGAKNNEANGMVKTPTYALVERIFYRADFTTLSLP